MWFTLDGENQPHAVELVDLPHPVGRIDQPILLCQLRWRSFAAFDPELRQALTEVATRWRRHGVTWRAFQRCLSGGSRFATMVFASSLFIDYGRQSIDAGSQPAAGGGLPSCPGSTRS